MRHAKNNIFHICKNGERSDDCVKNGYGWIVNKETGQKEQVSRYRCNKCKRTFYPRNIGYEVSRDTKQLRRLILELYLEGLSEKKIRKALKNYPVNDTYMKSDADSCIDDFFKNTPPHIFKYLNGMRPKDGELLYYPQSQGVEDSRYSLYIEGGEAYTAYTLHHKGKNGRMPSLFFKIYEANFDSVENHVLLVQTITDLLCMRYDHLSITDVKQIFKDQLTWFRDEGRAHLTGMKPFKRISNAKYVTISRMIRDLDKIFTANYGLTLSEDYNSEEEYMQAVKNLRRYFR